MGFLLNQSVLLELTGPERERCFASVARKVAGGTK